VQICEESIEVEIPPLPVEGVEIERDVDGYWAEVEKADEVDVVDWEDELHEEVDAGNARDVHGWNELRKQIELDLKKGERTLSISQTIKLLLL